MTTLTRPEEAISELLKEPAGPPTIGRYEILGTLGRGNMGHVYRARDPMIGRLVALKTRRFDLVYEQKDLRYVIGRFFEEARIAGNLIHPHIVTIYDVGQDGDHCYIAMELLEGQTLAAYNKEASLLPVNRVIELIRQICYTLDFAHSHRVIHRDIKPANLMFTLDKTIKVTDFGIATTAHPEKTSEPQVLGTPSYMSPEQTKGLKLTNQTDFFSLGIVLFELLCGRRPFLGRTLYELLDNIRYAATPSILRLVPDIPHGLDEVLRRALEKEPEARYQTGKEFAEDLDRAMQGKPISQGDDKASKKVDLIKSVEFFRNFNRKEIETIIRAGAFIRYDRSQVIVRDGEVDTTFFVLLNGRVRVIKNKTRIADLTQGECFGEMGAFTRQPRSAHVVAKEPCIVLKLDLKLIEREDPDLKLKFYKIFIETLSERLSTATVQLSALKKEAAAKK